MEIKNLFVVSVNAGVAQRAIQEDIPAWNPALEPGFQGRQVLLFGTCVEEDRPEWTALLAIGNDGEVRQACESIEGWIASGVIGLSHHTSNAKTAWQAMVDNALANAMPSSWLDGIETSIAFTFAGSDLSPERERRLGEYREAFIAPRRHHVGVGSLRRTWRVSFGLEPIGRLYAMAETEGSNAIGACLAIEPGYEGGQGIEIIRAGWADWFRQTKCYLAA